MPPFLQEILVLCAVLCATLFAGAAIYVSLVEHPARMQCGTATALTVWGPSYRRATVMQATLAVAGCIAGMVSGLHEGSLLWMCAALLLGAVVPFTLIVIMPVTKKLSAPALDPAAPEADALLERWGRLHHVRSLLGLASALLFLMLLQAR